MSAYASSSGVASAPTFGLHPGAGQQQHQLHEQQSQIALERQFQQSQHHLHQLQLQQQAEQGPPPRTAHSAEGSGSEPSGSANRNGAVNLGMGILNKLGLDRKTNRDGQPAKRRGPKPDSKPALTRRQELNRQAQRTHRQRKEVYIKTLEDQVMLYKEQCAQAVQSRNVAQEENKRLRELLLRHGIALPDNLHLIPTHGYGGYPSSSTASEGDYASPASYQASGSEYGNYGPPSAASGNTNGPSSARSQQPLNEQVMQNHPGEDQAGIDFVLALEAFCNDHTQYLCVRSAQSADTELPVASGHALMLSCPPLSHIENRPSDPYPHQAPPIPTPSLASLLQAAKQLPMVGDGEITPVMALKMVQEDMRYSSMRFKDFSGVTEELKAKTRCYGFGAVLEEFEVRDALENAFALRGD